MFPPKKAVAVRVVFHSVPTQRAPKFNTTGNESDAYPTPWNWKRLLTTNCGTESDAYYIPSAVTVAQDRRSISFRRSRRRDPAIQSGVLQLPTRRCFARFKYLFKFLAKTINFSGTPYVALFVGFCLSLYHYQTFWELASFLLKCYLKQSFEVLRNNKCNINNSSKSKPINLRVYIQTFSAENGQHQ